ncbi:MAG: HAMP domain-containing sensor histidine kinase [Bacteroidota bacterium]|nr:HAMP domain-containing sensor histidine kinase [Bacteroidota bacterium]
MNRKVIISLIIGTSFVLLGLVGMQIYWINNAINLKESNFNRSVDEAISKVVSKLEQMEAANRITQRTCCDKSGSSFLSTLDTLNFLFLKELDSIPWDKDMKNSTLDLGNENIRIEITIDDSGNLIKKIDTDFYDKKNASRNNSIRSMISINPSVPKDILDNLNGKLKTLWQKSFMMSDVFEDIFYLGQEKSIEEKVSKSVLDSLITKELHQKGIDTKFEFGIYSTSQKKFVLQKTGEYRNQLAEHGFTFSLYPSEMFMNPEYLIIYFPQEKKFLVTKLAGMISVSLILVILVFLSFIFIIKTLIDQKRLSEMKNDFINNMTHEFKTPISTVSLACEALSDKDIKKSEELYSSYISMISEENKRLGSLAEKILQTAIIDKGDLELYQDLVDINVIIEEAISINKMQVEIKDGVIERDINAGNSFVIGDHDHLLNVFNNLLDNANKYSPKKPRIIISTENTQNEIVISVKDNGIGVSKANQKKIFDKLYRVHTGDVHDVKGFGLGLSYVQFIIEKLNGRIQLESELNKGSVFKIFLPFKK